MKNVVDQKTFRAVKLLLQSGAATDEVAEFMNISSVTVSRIRNSETLEEYKHKMCVAAMQRKARNLEKVVEKVSKEPAKEPAKEPVQEPAKPVPPPPSATAGNYTMIRILEEIKAQNELLKVISNKMAFIVEQLV